MVTSFMHREGPVTAGDTRTALVTQGATAAPGVIKVPTWAKRIVTLTVAVGDNTPTAADGGHNYLVTLSGDGMIDGDQTMCVGSCSSDFTTAGDTGVGGRCFQTYNVDINVEANGIVNIYGEATLGVLFGQPEFGVTIQFASQ
jgi:hypothetical protein